MGTVGWDAEIFRRPDWSRLLDPQADLTDEERRSTAVR